MRRRLSGPPRRIVLIKAHSAGVGDILRSSAAWATLKKRWPDAELHLIFLTRWPGYPSESLIAGHHLLRSAHFLPLREGRWLGMRGVGPTGWRTLLPELRRLAQKIRPDLIIDHEPHGLESTVATRILRAYSPGAVTVGVAQVPGRGALYDMAGPSFGRYAKERGLPDPMDYTHRDFAALAALGLERDGQGIVLKVGPEGRAWQSAHPRLPGEWRIGLNIGCGTPDALPKRPDLDLLVEALNPSAFPQSFSLWLTGAANEAEINDEFLRRYRQRWGDAVPLHNLAGAGSLVLLTGIIASCDVFLSSDSGPYHMAVGLGKATMALFRWANPEHYHVAAGLKVLVDPSAKQISDALHCLLPLPE
ncbi:glycosyltransferase family 9 protein [Acidithiobacillus sp. IBUN Pt1247-S3]